MGGQHCDPTPAEPNQNGKKPRLVIVAETPGRTEEALGRPLIGQTGAMVNDVLSEMGVKRSECFLTNTMKCRPHRKLTGAEWKKARECCRPLLEKELAGRERVVALGAHAITELAGKTGVAAWRGYPLPGVGPYAHLSVFPMQHPAALFRKPSDLPGWLIDFSRAIQFSEGELEDWEWPKEIISDGPELVSFLKEVQGAKHEIAIDVETAGADPFTSRLTVLGLATAKTAASFEWPPSSSETEQLFKEILADETIPKILQNGTFDWIALEAAGLTFRGFVWDTLFAGCVIAPQIAHDLGHLASLEYFAPRWKSEFRVSGDAKGADRFAEADPVTLKLYNARDNFMTLLLKQAQEKRLAKIHLGDRRFREMMRLGELGKRMKVRGMLVDSAAREKHRTELRKEVAENERKFLDIVGREINWRSTPQLRKLFFDEYEVEPTQFDKETGEAKLDAAALGDILAAAPGTTPGKAAAALHRLRERSKLLSTYVEELPVYADGCVHPWWKFFTVTGRWSSDSPNMQNVPKPLTKKDSDGKEYTRPGMRDMFIARPGMWLVEADYSQLELRILALLSGDEPLLDAYARGDDVHALNAASLFDVPKASETQRDFAKRFVYGLNYGGGDKTIHKSLVVTYPHLTVEDIAEMRERWKHAHPQLAEWQEKQLLSGKFNRYVEAPLSGRRYYFFLGRVEPTVCFNYPMQSSAADIVNRATLEVDAALDASRGEHIILQVHDALVCEGPDPKRIAEIMKREMSLTVELNGKANMFPVDLKMGRCWGKMEKLKL